MTYDDLIAHFGTPAAAANARGIERQRVFGWKQRNRIPLEEQVEFEVLTEGKLRADLPDQVRQQVA